MGRLLLFAIMFIFLQTIAISEDYLPHVWSSVVPVTDSTKPNYDDDMDYDNFAGRLYVDDVDIDVALYLSNKQEVVDRKDSAAYFYMSSASGHMLIADHNTHAFGSLGNVQRGAIARIVKENGEVVYYKCIDIFKGHNTGKGITDWNGNNVVGQADLLMYTCFDGWENIWVALWNEVRIVNGIDIEQAMDNFMTANQNLIEELFKQLENPVPDMGEDEEIELIFEYNPS